MKNNVYKSRGGQVLCIEKPGVHPLFTGLTRIPGRAWSAGLCGYYILFFQKFTDQIV